MLLIFLKFEWININMIICVRNGEVNVKIEYGWKGGETNGIDRRSKRPRIVRFA